MIVVHAHGFDTLDMKPLVKFPANRLDLFILIKTKEKKRKKKKTLPLFHTYWHQEHRGTLHMVSEPSLKRSDLMDSSTYTYVFNYVI